MPSQPSARDRKSKRLRSPRDAILAKVWSSSVTRNALAFPFWCHTPSTTRTSMTFPMISFSAVGEWTSDKRLGHSWLKSPNLSISQY